MENILLIYFNPGMFGVAGNKNILNLVYSTTIATDGSLKLLKPYRAETTEFLEKPIKSFFGTISKEKVGQCILLILSYISSFFKSTY